MILQGWGGALYLLRGSRIQPINMLFQSVENTGTETSTPNPGPHDPTSSLTTWVNKWFGGYNTWNPSAYANHKPIAIFNGFIYQTLHRLNNITPGASYITRFDGSGIFINTGNSNYNARSWSNGRGTELMSPSGTSHVTRMNDMGMIEHNNNLFIVGAVYNKETVGSNAWRQNGWAYTLEGSLGNDRSDRSYAAITIQYDGKKIFGPTTKFLPDVSVDEYTHVTDAISFKNDIYFANWVDTVKIQGGSGTISLLHSDLKSATARCFATFPTSGYSNAGIPIGETMLLTQTGSGVINKINTTRTNPSGISQLVDLGSVAGTVRPYDNFRARLDSSTNEPGRSCLMFDFDNKLHSFIASATSGYQHFICDGSPSGTTNWTDSSLSLPFDLRRYDGNVYGLVDDLKQKMFLCHVTMGEVGVVGHAGIAKGAGGVYVYQYDTNDQWTEVYRGVPGLTPRGLIPIQNIGPWVSMPSGNNPTLFKCSDYAIIQYNLHDLFNRGVDVDIEYSINEGLTWHNTTRFKAYNIPFGLLGSGTSNLPSHLNGIQYDFYWHYINDVGFNSVDTAMLRIRPKLSR